ncbi:MAG: rhomboid family intramembrane serine protease [Myxococcota bacterium]
MRVELRQGAETHLVDLDVELDVRRGRLFAEDELRYAPWTGAAFRRLRDIPALDDAFAAPEARFAAWIRARRFPVATLVTLTVVSLAGAVQIGATVAGVFSPDLARRVTDAILWGAIGYEPLLLDGAWWSPWTSQLLHAGAVHLLMNLPVLGYCGFRVERALGVGGFAVVAAAAVLGGTAAITALGSLPVVGASILAYGFWGAQIAVGFRVGEAMPPGWRGFYGWGNLVLFVPLFAAGLGSEGVSHLGHLGGLAGGVIAGLVVPAESFRRRGEVAERRRANLRIAAVLGALPMVAAPALARSAPALALPAERVEAPDAGVTVEVPWRMADHPVRFAGLPAWVVSPNADEPVFVGLVRLRAPVSPTPEELGWAWAEAIGGRLEPIAPPPPPRDGFTSHAWRVRDPATDAIEGTLVEHDLRRGVWLLRVGYHLRDDAVPDAGREALYRHVLGTIEVGEPPALVAARRAHDLYPYDPAVAWTYARALGDAGDVVAADLAWEALAARPDGWRWEAARGRLRLWRQAELGGVDALLDDRIAAADRADWPLGWLGAAPADAVDLHGEAIAWLAAHGMCQEAVGHALAVEADGVLDYDVREALAGCTGPRDAASDASLPQDEP